MNNQRLTSLYKKMNTNRIYAYKKEKINFESRIITDGFLSFFEYP